MVYQAATMVPAPRQGRINRRPSHRFQIRSKPWQIQPFMIAPVIPGETLSNLMLQCRVVSDPVKNPLIGAHQEYYFFYVKHRDLEAREDFTEMMLDLQKDLTGLYAAADPKYYHYGGTIPWLKLCTDRIVAEYFRTEADEANVHEIDGVPIAYVNQDTWLDSVINDADFIPVADVEVEGPDANATIQASEIDQAMRTWQFQRANGLTDMDYEDFLRTYGVSIPKAEELHRPELIRWIREWSYPTNTVEPTTGAPSTAFSYAIAERADKNRFFKEPGFLVGYSIFRPKVYFSKQVGAAAGMLNDALAWLPAIMRDDPYTSLRKLEAASGPLSTNTDAYWVDVKDLFLYGDQFANFALTETDAGMVALPTAALQKHYVTSADIDALFKDAAGGKNLVRQDGIVTLSIAGALIDTTPPVSRFGV